MVELRWRGGDIDRLIDEVHAALVARSVRLLERHRFETLAEVTYSVFGERGSIDVLAWRRDIGTCVVVEVKSELTSLEQTLRKHDEKVRLAPSIVADRLGWRPRVVARLLVLPELSTARRAVMRYTSVLAGAYPIPASVVRPWLGGGAGPGGGILFLSLTRPGSARRKRVRLRQPSAADRPLPTLADSRNHAATGDPQTRTSSSTPSASS